MEENKSTNLIDLYDKNIKFYTEKLTQLRVVQSLLDDVNSLLTDPIFKKLNINLQPTVYEKDLLTVTSVLGYTGVFRIEISIIAKHLILSTQEWEKIFFLQRLFLIIHEAFNTYKSFGVVINRYKKFNHISLAEKADSIRKSRKEIKKYITEKELAQLRNNSAHFNPNFTVYYDTLLSIAENPYINLIIKDFFSFCDQLMEISHEIEATITSEISKQYSSVDIQNINVIKELSKLRGNKALCKSIKEKIEKDYSPNDVDGLQLQVLLTLSYIKSGLTQEDALIKTNLSEGQYIKYKPE